MKAQAIVSALDYLDGLVVILERLAEQGEGVHLVAMKVDSIDATLTRLRDAGIRLVGDPGAGNPVKGQVFIHPSVTGGVLTQIVER